MQELNYSLIINTGWASYSPGALWSAFDFFYDSRDADVIGLFTHFDRSGGEADVLDEDGNLTTQDVWYKTPVNNELSFESTRSAYVGTGLPPYNSTQNPPINFALLCGCHSVDDPFRLPPLTVKEADQVLFPKQNYYSSGEIENQSYLGFLVFVTLVSYQHIAYLVMDELAQGSTVYGAKVRLAAYAQDYDILVRDYDNVPQRILTSSDVYVGGDPHTRITSVYTASNVAPIGWYRRISSY